MRIAFFVLSLNERGGGSHQNAATIIRDLRARGHDVDVHAMLKHGTLPPDIAVQAERGDGLSFPELQRQCAEAMRSCEERTDVFLVYGQALTFGAGMYRLFGGVKPVTVYLDSHLDSMKEAYRGVSFFQRLKHLIWGKTYGLILARTVDAYAAVSPYLVERFVRFGFPRRAFTVVSNAFKFNPRTAPASLEEGAPMRLLYVGRLSFEKGLDVLFHALSLIPKDSWRLRVVGEGMEHADLEHTARSLHIKEFIEIVPWMSQDSLVREYAAANALVVPSRVPEPFGRVIVEAMHAGLPVVIPKVGGAPWVAGGGGVTFTNGDEISLRAALVSLQDEEHRLSLGVKGRARAAEFSVERVTIDLERVLQLCTRVSGVHGLSKIFGSILRLGRFLISGGIATGVNLLALYVLVHVLEMWYLTSSIIAFFVGFIASFTLQKFWTFKDRRRDVMRKQLVIYLAIVLVNLILNTALVYIFVEYGKLWPLVAQALAALIIAFEGFFAYKYFVFRTDLST
ncbi:glycosyltransferase [Candidatus Kaiserbacteria bacterium]|nr:glycosyltransferase [Candidatus Kaiserbacteria bacterium]